MEFERWIEFEPAYDRRDPAPKKNYGIHGVSVRFLLRGREGVVQFLLFTNWHLPHVQKELDANFLANSLGLVLYHPLPADFGYHAKVPFYDGQQRMDCQYIEGGCYYDGSGLDAERFYDILLLEGSDGVWTALEAYYAEILEKEAKT